MSSTDIRIRRRTFILYLVVAVVVVCALLSSGGAGGGGSREACLHLHQQTRDLGTEPPVLYSVVRADKLVQTGGSHDSNGVGLVNRTTGTVQCSPGDGKKAIIPDLPMIYAITPTYARPVQKAELTRLSQTLMWLENFHWIVVEDSDKKTALVENFLKNSKIQYTHLVSRTIKNKILKPTEPHWMKARGVEQRNAGLDWLRKNLSRENLNGVLFFMDDDNTYSLELFNEMRKVHKVGVWPVGLVGGMMVEKPLVNEAGDKVIGFNSVWRPERPFPIDMAGFAIHLKLITDNPHAVFTHKVQAGYQESEILRQLITRTELEPLADRCSKVFVWHTRTEKPKMNEENKLRAKKNKGSDFGIEV